MAGEALGKVRPWEENLQEESEEGNEGLTLTFLTSPVMSPSCRVSHGIAGTLLGEMALCAKKRPPGKTGRKGGLESLGSSRLGVTMALGAKGGGTTGSASGGGSITTPAILVCGGQPSKANSSPGCLSFWALFPGVLRTCPSSLGAPERLVLGLGRRIPTFSHFSIRPALRLLLRAGAG